MLADPISVKVATVATNHPRVAVASEYNEYSVPDGTSSVRVGSSRNKNRHRNFVTSAVKKIAADPLTAVNQQVQAVVSLSVTRPPTGFSIAELKTQVLDLCDFLTASTGANTEKIVGGER